MDRIEKVLDFCTATELRYAITMGVCFVGTCFGVAVMIFGLDQMLK